MEATEIWRPVYGLEKFYEVSSYGRVRNSKRVLMTQYPTHGYLKVVLTQNSIRKNYRVHRLVLEAFVGPRPDGMMCRHLDGNRQNNHLGNLAWGTNAENQADRIAHGTSNRGANAPANVLTDSQVLQIFKDPRSTRAIALDYSVNAETVRRIKAGKTWAWLTGASLQTGLCRGSLHRHSKLNELQVMAIKSDLRAYTEIAAEYGVNQATVGKIKTGKTWSHVEAAGSVDGGAS
jgi:hypothetical protein